MRETSRKIELNADQTRAKLNQLNQVEAEVEKCNANIGIISARLDSINGQIATLNDSIAVMDRHLKQITVTYAKALRRQQGTRRQMSALAFIFSSESFAQAFRRTRSLKQFARWREQRAAEINNARKALDAKRKRLGDLSAAVTRSRNDLSGQRATLVAKKTETESLVDELRSQGASLQEVMREQRSRAAALDRELDAIIQREIRRQEEERRAREAEQARRAEEARKAEQERREAEAQEKARRDAEAAARAAAAEEARKAEAARQAEAAQRRAEAEAHQRELAAEKARKDAEYARKNAKKQAEKEAAARKKAEAEAARKAADEAKKAEKEAQERARKAEADRKKAEADRKKADENKRREESRRNAKPVKRSQKGASAGGSTAATLSTPASAAESGTASATVEAGSNFESLKGRLSMPVAGNYTIVRKFGRQKHPSLPHVETDNAGIDIQTAPNAGVRAVCDGEVSAVFQPEGYNSVVVVRHGNYLTVYANLGAVNVRAHQQVKAGQSLGAVYSDSSDRNRSVLHFEIRHNRTKENPEVWLRR